MDISDDGSHSSELQETQTQQLPVPCHNGLKILKHIRTLGCTHDEICAATYRTYLDLCEVRKYESVSFHFSAELDHLFLKVRKQLADEEEIIVPVTTTKQLSFKDMELFQDFFKSDSINLAICDSSSVNMYYKLTRSK